MTEYSHQANMETNGERARPLVTLGMALIFALGVDFYLDSDAYKVLAYALALGDPSFAATDWYSHITDYNITYNYLMAGVFLLVGGQLEFIRALFVINAMLYAGLAYAARGMFPQGSRGLVAWLVFLFLLSKALVSNYFSFAWVLKFPSPATIAALFLLMALAFMVQSRHRMAMMFLVASGAFHLNTYLVTSVLMVLLTFAAWRQNKLGAADWMIWLANLALGAPHFYIIAKALGSPAEAKSAAEDILVNYRAPWHFKMVGRAIDELTGKFIPQMAAPLVGIFLAKPRLSGPDRQWSAWCCLILFLLTAGGVGLIAFLQRDIALVSFVLRYAPLALFFGFRECCAQAAKPSYLGFLALLMAIWVSERFHTSPPIQIGALSLLSFSLFPWVFLANWLKITPEFIRTMFLKNNGFKRVGRLTLQVILGRAGTLEAVSPSWLPHLRRISFVHDFDDTKRGLYVWMTEKKRMGGLAEHSKRILLFAVLAILVPAALLAGKEWNPGQGGFSSWRKYTEEAHLYHEVYQWLRDNTKPGDLLLVSPKFFAASFFTARGVVVDFKRAPYLPVDVVEWKRRIDDVVGPNPPATQWGESEPTGYEGRPLKDLFKVSSKYGASHVLVESKYIAEPDRTIQPVYTDRRFSVFISPAKND